MWTFHLVVSDLGLQDVADEQTGRGVTAQEQAVGQVPLDLQGVQVARVFFLELARIWCIEFDAEDELQVALELFDNRLVIIQPALNEKRSIRWEQSLAPEIGNCQIKLMALPIV